jgi:phosphate uptake regulator
MESRKLQVVGGRSYSVSLPKNWIIDNRLANHDTVFIRTTAQNELVISKAEGKAAESNKIDLVVENPDTLPEFLVFCYIKNISSILLRIKENPAKVASLVRQALRYLEGFEITNEDEKMIEVSFVFNEVQITIPRIIQRIFYLIKLHVEALKQKDAEALNDAEQSVDRLYHLSTRLLFSCMHDPGARTENEISDDEEIFYTNLVLKRLENVSDQLLKLKDQKLKPKDIEFLEQMLPLLSRLLGTKEKAATIKQSLAKLLPESKDPRTEAVLHKLHDLTKDVYEAKISMEFNNALQKKLTKLT